MQTGVTPITDTLGFLLGAWQVTREIDDRRAGTAGVFSGMAVLAGAPGADLRRPGAHAQYTETGTLRYGQHRGPAQRFLGATRLDGGGVLLSFADGRPFIDLDLSSGACERVHPCREDTYELATFVRSAGLLEERWWVHGPATDYRAVTTLLRTG